ncbi:DnaJ-17, partial [Operophtera brumata]
MDEEGDNVLLEENYYQLLNVSKTATSDEINSAYRRMSRMFHPDKHATDRANQQKWAEQVFNKVKEAYEVLSDSHKRAIYDTLGNGSVNISNRYLSSEKGWTELECGIGNGPLLGFKLFRSLSRMMFLNCGTVMQFTPRGISPSFFSNAHSVGYLTYRAGSQGSSMSTIYVRDSERYHSNVAIQIGKPHSFASMSLMWKLPSYDMKLRLALKGGTFGAIVEYGAEKKVSQNNSVSAAVMVGVPSGVILKLKWTNSSQTIVVPIQLCEEVVPSPVFYATVVPIVSWLILRKLVLDPIAKEREQRNKIRSMEANFERLQEMQRQARATVELMKATFTRIRSDEEKKKGLVILKALYGKLPQDCSSHPVTEPSPGDVPTAESPLGYAEVIDVTIPLQCLIKDSRLELLDASKSELPGFYDPCVGEAKHLTVQYMFHANLHSTT